MYLGKRTTIVFQKRRTVRGLMKVSFLWSMSPSRGRGCWEEMFGRETRPT